MSNATVLVVDDEPLIRWSLVNRLKQDGYRTLEAGSAADAVALHRDGADLVLLDYALPDANGLAVLKQVKETDPDTLVIMLTAQTGVETAVEAMKHGAFHYLNKPFDLDAGDAAGREGARDHPAAPRGQGVAGHPGSAVRAKEHRRRERGHRRRPGAAAEDWRQPRFDGAADGRERHRQGPGGQGHPLQQCSCARDRS